MREQTPAQRRVPGSRALAPAQTPTRAQLFHRIQPPRLARRVQGIAAVATGNSTKFTEWAADALGRPIAPGGGNGITPSNAFDLYK